MIIDMMKFVFFSHLDFHRLIETVKFGDSWRFNFSLLNFSEDLGPLGVGCIALGRANYAGSGQAKLVNGHVVMSGRIIGLFIRL